MPNISVGESFIFALNSGTEKVWIRRWEYQDFPSRSFCLTVAEINVAETFTVALFSGSEKVWIGGGGVSRFSVENFSSHSAEISGKGTLYCRPSFGYREGLNKRGGGESRYSFEVFLSHGDGKFSVRESFVALISGTEEVWRRGGVSIKIFRRKFFVSQCRNIP